jgi:hypothetical protein
MPRIARRHRTPAVRAIIVTLGSQSTIFYLKKELLLERNSAVEYLKAMRETANGLVPARTDRVRFFHGALETPEFVDWNDDDFEIGDDQLACMELWTTKEAGVMASPESSERDKETVGPCSSNNSVHRESTPHT